MNSFPTLPDDTLVNVNIRENGILIKKKMKWGDVKKRKYHFFDNNNDIVDTSIMSTGKNTNNNIACKKVSKKELIKPATKITIAEWESSGIEILPTAEYKFCIERKWMIDYAFPSLKIGVEIEGGIYIGGRHINPKGYLKDQEKYNKMAEEGWLLLRYQPKRHNFKQIKAAIDKKLIEIHGLKKEGESEYIEQHRKAQILQ